METQLEFGRVNGWGGRRKNSGRKGTPGSVKHKLRPEVKARHPLHIGVKISPAFVDLRRPEVHSAFLEAVERAKAKGLKINEYALVDFHLHLVAEAENKKVVECGMKSFLWHFAKKLQELSKMKGPVYIGRFFMRVLKTPTEVRNVLRYVLLNLAKHMKLIAFIDRFSSAGSFKAWRRLVNINEEPLIRDHIEDPRIRAARPAALSDAQSWLGKEGWLKARGA